MLNLVLFSPNGYVGSFMKKKIKCCVKCKLLEITRESDLDKIVGCYDVFIYSAAVTSERKADAEQYIRDNALCAITMMEFCKKHFVKRIIYISTDEIYGKLQAERITENEVMVSPNIYAVTKYLAEKIIIQSGIKYYILRLPGIVGGRWGNSFLYNLMERIAKNEKIYLYNLNKVFNNVVDIEDLIEFIWTLVHYKDNNSQIFLLGNERNILLADLVEYIRCKYSSDSDIIYMEEGERRYFTLDITKALEYGYHSKDIITIVDELYQYKNGG